MYRSADEEALREEWRVRAATFLAEAAGLDRSVARAFRWAVARFAFATVAAFVLLLLIVGVFAGAPSPGSVLFYLPPSVVSAAILGHAVAPALLALVLRQRVRATNDVRADLERLAEPPATIVRALGESLQPTSLAVAAAPALILVPLLVFAGFVFAVFRFFDGDFSLRATLATALPWFAPSLVGAILWARRPRSDWTGWHILFLVPAAFRFPIAGVLAIAAQAAVGTIVSRRIRQGQAPLAQSRPE